MTKASTKKGMAGKLLAAGCSLALAASLTPAAALTALAAGNPAQGTIQVIVKQGSTEVTGFRSTDTKNVVNLNDDKVEKVKGKQSTLYFVPSTADNSTKGTWGVITSSEAGVASFDEIFENAKGTGATAASYWQPGAKLTVSGAAAAATDPTLTYEQVAAATNFYSGTKRDAETPAGAATPVTPGIALSAANSLIAPDSEATAAVTTNLAGLKANATAGSVLSVGLSAANYDVANMAQYMPMIATITITLPEQEYQNVPRIYGEDWNDTMNAVVNKSNSAANQANFVVASSNNYQDALTASGLAGALQCPLLLTDKDELTQQTADQISTRAAANGAHVYIIGGPLAVSESVKTKINQLDAIKGKIQNPVIRLAGETAAETSLKVYEKMAEIAKVGGTYTANMTTAVVTTSIAFQDAMSISPYTYANKIPVVLTGDGNVLSSDTLAALEKQTTASSKLQNAIVLGGNLAVSDSVEGQLFGAGLTTVKRIGEETCWETSNAIAEYLSDAKGANWGASTTLATVATGDNYLDALVASQWCAQQGKQVLLLVGNGEGGDYCVTNYIEDTSTLKTVYIVGGPQAVSPTIAAQINKAIS